MRTLIVAALLATAAAAHLDACENMRYCNGFTGQLGGLCSNTAFGFMNICPKGQMSYDVNARMPVDAGCFGIKPYAIEVRDTNGTTSATRMLSSFSGSGIHNDALSTNCTESPYCVKPTEDANMTMYMSGGMTSGSTVHYVDRDSEWRSFSGSAAMYYLGVRQGSFLSYGTNQEHRLGVNRGDVLVYLSLSVNTWINPHEDTYFLFRIANHGSNPFEMSLSEGDRRTANGLQFLEKAVNATGSYDTVFPTVWSTPSMEVVERFELNEVTYKYEVSQFLSIKVPNKDKEMALIGTISRP